MNCNTQTFLLRWIYWFCDLNWIIVISFHRPNSPHSPSPNWLISTAWVEFDRGVEEQTLVQSDQCGGLSCSGLNERPCPSGWNRSDLLDGPFYSHLICGISDEVFWEVNHVQHGWHRKREVYYYIHNRCIMRPLNVIALDNKTSNQVASVNEYWKSFTQNNQLDFV